jgi:hypothetical protein
MNLPEGAWEDPRNPIHEKPKDECPFCFNSGRQLISCCGDSMNHLIENNKTEYVFLCPSCGDWFGAEIETCEYCHGKNN